MSSKPNKDEILKFSQLIGELSIKLDLPVLDTIVHHCEETGLEIELASSLLSNALKSKIREESEKVNLVKKSAKLPI